LHVWFDVPPQRPSQEIFLAAVADGLAEEEVFVLVLVVRGRVDVVARRVLVVRAVLVVLRVVMGEVTPDEEGEEETAVLDETGAIDEGELEDVHVPKSGLQPVPQ
jgi:hypothetical protein